MAKKSKKKSAEKHGKHQVKKDETLQNDAALIKEDVEKLPVEPVEADTDITEENELNHEAEQTHNETEEFLSDEEEPESVEKVLEESEETKAQEHHSEKKSKKKAKQHHKPVMEVTPVEPTEPVETEEERMAKLEAKKKTLAVIKKVAIGVGIFVVVIGLFAGFLAYSNQRIFPRTQIIGMDIGSSQLNKVKENLTLKANEYLKAPIAFDYNGKQVPLTPEQLGIELDLEQTVKSIPVFSLENPDIGGVTGSIFMPKKLTFQYKLNENKALQLLRKSFELDAKAPQNASLSYKDKKFQVNPEKTGIVIDKKSLLDNLDTNVSQLESSAIALVTVTQEPTVAAVELEKQQASLTPLLQKSITLFHGTEKMTLPLIEHLDAVEFVRAGDTVDGQHAASSDKIEIQLNQTKLDPFLVENLIKDLEVVASPVSISTNAEGKVLFDGKAEDGKVVPREALYAKLNQAVNKSEAKVEVPLDTQKATVTISEDLQKLGITELLSTGYTTYFGSPANRMHNINVGIAKYNGLLIKPGEEFSFNTTLGAVDGRSGYKMEKVIKGNKAEYEYGGGICQVSTTLYRGLLYAGLPITARRAHTWKVSYYSQVLGPGLDATIYLGGQDLKFMNDTGNTLLLQSFTDGAKAYFKIYGTSDGRTVKLDGPFGGGLSYRWVQHIFDKDGKEIKTETITSKYIPMPVEAPKTENPTPPAAAVPPKSTF